MKSIGVRKTVIGALLLAVTACGRTVDEDSLVGTWELNSAGDAGPSRLVIRADGTFTNKPHPDESEVHGTYTTQQWWITTKTEGTVLKSSYKQLFRVVGDSFFLGHDLYRQVRQEQNGTTRFESPVTLEFDLGDSSVQGHGRAEERKTLELASDKTFKLSTSREGWDTASPPPDPTNDTRYWRGRDADTRGLWEERSPGSYSFTTSEGGSLGLFTVEDGVYHDVPEPEGWSAKFLLAPAATYKRIRN